MQIRNKGVFSAKNGIFEFNPAGKNFNRLKE